MRLPDRVDVVEVGPRDGFQAEHEWIPTEKKVEVIDALTALGFRTIQATALVHPRAIPQLADAEEVMARVKRPAGVEFDALVPNVRGLQRALKCNLDAIHLMISVTESHNRSNANRSVEDSLAEFRELVPVAHEAGLETEGGMACVFGCPFEGEVPVERVEWLVGRYVDLGVKAINLGDTIGVANPRQGYDVCARLLDRFPDVRFTLHCHNTRGMALAVIASAMQAGITRFDSAVGGLGGCPYAPGATGNIASEDLVYMLEEMGVKTGIDLDGLIEVARGVREVVGHPLESSLVRAGKRTDLKPAPRTQEKMG